MAPRSVPRSECVDLPAPFMDLAQRRTEFLFQHMTYGDLSMRRVLASAYLQGMSDCVDALVTRNRITDAPIEVSA